MRLDLERQSARLPFRSDPLSCGRHAAFSSAAAQRTVVRKSFEKILGKRFDERDAPKVQSPHAAELRPDGRGGEAAGPNSLSVVLRRRRVPRGLLTIDGRSETLRNAHAAACGCSG